MQSGGERRFDSAEPRDDRRFVVAQQHEVRREPPEKSGDDGQPQSDDDAFDALFTRNGHYQDPPSDWGDPERAFERREFFEILQLCVDRLPARTGRIFMMREWLELETEEICKELAISTSNAWVLLYRARLRLRECLQLNWFSTAGDQQGATR